MKITFYYPNYYREWSADTVETEAIGGTEYQVWNVANYLSKYGHDVCLYTNTKNKFMGGITWIPYELYNPEKLDTDIFITVECFNLILPSNYYKLYYWVHNIWYNYTTSQINSAINTGGNFIVLSDFHASNMSKNFNTSYSKFIVLNYGWNYKYFPKTLKQKNPYKMVSCSRPERAFKYLPKIFKLIKNRIPKAELHLMTYTPQIINREDDPLGISTSLENENEKNIYYEFNKVGVTMHEGMSRSELWDFLKDANIALSPMNFEETFGGIHLEYIKMGLNVITSNTGANSNVLGDAGFIVDGDMDLPENIQKFADIACDIMEGKISNISTEENLDRFNIDDIIKKWIAAFKIKDFHDYIFLSNGRFFRDSDLENGLLGGSEAALVSVARTFAKIGKSVVVIANCETGIFNGILYLNINKSYHKLKTRNVISFRFPYSGDYLNNLDYTYSHLWCEDDIDQPFMEDIKLPEIQALYDSVWALSQYHKERLISAGIPENKIIITTNGVHKKFIHKKNKVGDKAIYCSAPYRGLDKLIELAPNIYKETGVITHVFSSMELYGEDNKDYTHLIKEMANTDGIIYRGVVPKLDLFKEMASADYFIYPSTFPETCCTAIIEAQVHGCIPIVTDLGSLKEKTGNGKYGKVTNNFVKEIKYLQSNTEAKENLKNICSSILPEVRWSSVVANLEESINHITSSKVSVCMIAKNEENNIGEAIRSVKNMADEVLVLDTGSTDKTIEAAQKAGAICLNYLIPEEGFRFDHAKNTICSFAKYRWIFVLDADEIVSESSIESIRKELKSPSADAYTVLQKNVSKTNRVNRSVVAENSERRYMNGGKYYETVPIIRLFRNEFGFEHRGAVHEEILNSILERGCKVKDFFDVQIYNTGGLDEGKEEKFRRGLYLKLGERKIKDVPDNWKAYYELGVEYNIHKIPEKALNMFLRAETLLPKNINLDELREDVYSEIAYTYSQLENYDNMLKYYKKSMDKFPKNVHTLNNIACYYFNIKNDHKEAEKFWKKSLKIDPNYKLAEDNLKLIN